MPAMPLTEQKPAMSRPTSTPSVEPLTWAGWPPPVLDPAGPYAGSVTVADLGAVRAWPWSSCWSCWPRSASPCSARPAEGAAGRRRRRSGSRGVAFPAVVLTGLLIWGLTLTRDLSAPVRGDEMRIRVTGRDVVVARRLSRRTAAARCSSTPTSCTSRWAGRWCSSCTSADVIHSFWVPRLSGKLDMIPGRSNLLRIQADEPGVYGGAVRRILRRAARADGLQSWSRTSRASSQRWLAARQSRAAGGAAQPERSAASSCSPRWAAPPATASPARRRRRGRPRPHPRRAAPHAGRRHPAQQPRHADGLDRRQPGDQAGQPHAALLRC